MMQMSPELQKCTSINQVVTLINREWDFDDPAEQYAADYAYDVVKQGGYALYQSNLKLPLKELAENGAKFSIASVLEILEWNCPEFARE